MAPRKGWRRKLASSAASLLTGFDGPTCAFCGRPNSDDMVGELLSTDSLHAHYFCMLFSSSLPQNGPETDPLRGFEEEHVRAQLRRGQPCAFCKGKKATVACCSKACKKVFHVACGLANGCLLQFFDQFRAYCVSHRLRQCVVPSDGGHDLCAICAEEMVYPSLSVLVTPCCRHLFHRNCIQQQALSSGSHFFRCGHCNDQESFQKEMQTHGIYIPEQDASWEQEPHAFEELLFRYSRCDAARCFCPQGRKHSEQGSRWHLAICDGCGSGGVHAGCGNLALPATSWLCTNCRCILGRGFKPSSEPLKSKSDVPRPPDKPGACFKSSLSGPITLELNDTEPPGRAASTGSRLEPPKCRCRLCGRGFPSLRLLHGHLRCKHAKEWKGKHRCPHCLFSSRYRAVILIHKRAHTCNKKPFVCKVCYRSFFRQGLLNFHLKKHADDGSNKLALGRQSSDDQSGHHCDTIGLSGAGQPPRADSPQGCDAERDNHQPSQIDLSEQPHSCNVCGRKFSHASHLGRHMKVQHGRRLNEPSHSCELCSRKFAFLLHLWQRTKSLHARQLLTNVSKQPHSCRLCGRKFSFLCHLGQHIKSQQAMHPSNAHKRPFACRTCYRRFVLPCNLARHKKSVHGTQPAPADELTHLSKTSTPTLSSAGEMMSSEKSVLCKQHVLANNQALCCGTCKQKFSNDSELAFHEISEHGNQLIFTSEQARMWEASSREFFFDSQFLLQEKLVNGRKYSFLSETTRSCQRSCQEFLFDSPLALRNKSMNGTEYALASATTDSCETSSQKFAFDSPLLLPEKSVHSTENEQRGSQVLHSCKVCGQKYLSNRHLVQHQISVHGAQPVRASERPYSCKLCGQKFPHLSHLVRHEKAHPTWDAGNRHKLCNICGRRFLLACHLGRHKKLVHAYKGGLAGKQPHLCRQCEQSFPSASQLSVHKKSVHGDSEDARPFSCKVCGRRFRFVYRLLMHEKLHTKQLGHAKKEPHVCTACGRSFLFASQLGQHRKYTHGLSDGRERPYSCKLCSRSFLFRRNLRRHETAVHTKQEEKPAKHSQTFSSVSQLVRHHWCEICSRRFPRACYLATHKKFVHGSVNASSSSHCCEICCKKFPCAGDLATHKKLAHANMVDTSNRSYWCETCGKKFLRACHLAVHRKYKHGSTNPKNKSYSCEMGRKAFSRACHLSVHKKYGHGSTDAKNKSHPCEMCRKTFSRACHLATHRKYAHGNTGTGKRYHQCKMCSKKYWLACHLAVHMKSAHSSMDTSNKSNSCDICHKTFSRACYLAIHQKYKHRSHYARTRSKFHSCKKCGQKFLRPSCLLTHEKLVHANPDARNRPHSCKICSRKFLLACHLARHMKFVHGRKWAPIGTQLHTGTTCRDKFFPLSEPVSHDASRAACEKPHRCKMCGKEFSFHSQLAVHEKSFHDKGGAGERTHSSKTCGRKFLFQRNLSRNQKSTHPKPQVFTCAFEIRLTNLDLSRHTQVKLATEPAALPQQLELNKGLGGECERSSSAPNHSGHAE